MIEIFLMTQMERKRQVQEHCLQSDKQRGEIPMKIILRVPPYTLQCWRIWVFTLIFLTRLT